MIKFKSTKIRKDCELVDKYINRVHEHCNDLSDVDYTTIGDVLDIIDSWRTCIDEIELKIKTNNGSHADEINIRDYDDDNKELIIY